MNRASKRVEDREVAVRQHGDGIGLESKREPLVASEEPVELGFRLAKIPIFRLRRHLADQRRPSRSRSKRCDGWRAAARCRRGR